MSDIKLTYFDFNGGRGEDARLALHLAGVDFDDDRIGGREQWPGLKPHTPYGSLPVLTVAGRGEIAQSNAVLTYIGRTWGLHPSDPFDAAQHEAVMNSVEEIRHVVSAATHDDAAEKKRLREAFAAGPLLRWGQCIERQIAGPFLSGDTLQVADLKLAVMLAFLSKGALDHVSLDALSSCPKLLGLFEAVHADPAIQGWYAAHA